jgi:hypothetical protein
MHPTLVALITTTIHLSFAAAIPHLIPRDPVAQLISIAPTSSSCTGAPFPSECATASTAVGPLISSFATYSVSTAAEQAALLAWMSYESGEFKYNQNHFPAPGRPGQGTRTMMMPNFVAEYVASIPALAGQAAAAAGDPAATLALVENDTYSFGSAAWFYSTQCSEAIKSQLQTGSESGWDAFLTTCVGTDPSEGTGSTSRLAYWQRATAALGVVVS